MIVSRLWVPDSRLVCQSLGCVVLVCPTRSVTTPWRSQATCKRDCGEECHEAWPGFKVPGNAAGWARASIKKRMQASELKAFWHFGIGVVLRGLSNDFIQFRRSPFKPWREMKGLRLVNILSEAYYDKVLMMRAMKT